MTLEREFFARPVIEVARELVGCTLSHGRTAGVIVETEAYHESEPACHAYVGVTPRTRVLFGPPGMAYVYRSYGIHALVNAVCEPEGVGAAVLIRALEPIADLDTMRERRGLHDLPCAARFPASARGLVTASLARPEASPPAGASPLRSEQLCSGPGKLTQALAIELEHDDTDLVGGPIRLGPRPPGWEDVELVAGTRVGITKAAELEWRFCATGTRSVSRPWPPALRRAA